MSPRYINTRMIEPNGGTEIHGLSMLGVNCIVVHSLQMATIALEGLVMIRGKWLLETSQYG